MRTRRFMAVILSVALLVSPGCVGPNHIRRGLDEGFNQLTVDHPLLAEGVGIFYIVAVHFVAFADYLIMNPLAYWQSVYRGYGEPHYYSNPKVPGGMDDPDEDEDEAPGDAG